MASPMPRKDDTVHVYWDIKMCPIPVGCDVRRVGPCIKLFLRKLGYSGPITITAAGVLPEVPTETLEALFSTGISLHSGPFGSKDALLSAFRCFSRHQPTVNIMVISSPGNFSIAFRKLDKYGCNIIRADASILWPNLSVAVPEEVKCSGTGQPASCLCIVCHKLTFHDFKNFITHLSSRKHIRRVADYFIPVNANADASTPKNPN